MEKLYENKYFIFDRPYYNSLKISVQRFRGLCKGLYYASRLNHKPEELGSKLYNVSICAIFKNEARYLEEWLSFHRIVGVEHFFLYNNNSDDDYERVLRKYIDANIVTLHNWDKNQRQMEAYLDCINNHRNDTKWIGFIDIDEFVVPRKGRSINNILEQFENRGAVKLYWRLFGTSGKVSRDTTGLVTEDFTVCWPKFCDIGKCFYNTAFEIYVEQEKGKALHHDCWTKYNNIIMPPVNIYGKFCFEYSDFVNDDDFPIQINHYFTKSYDEYGLKKSRGDVYFKNNPHDDEYFFQHEMKCTAVDYSAYRFIIKLKKDMADNIL